MSTLNLADSAPRSDAPAGPKPVKLRTARDYSLTTSSLEHRAEELSKLAKKTKEEGYSAEARTIDADVGAIREFILPLFKEQRELPLVTTEYLEATVRNAVHAVLHRFAVSSDSATKADAARGVADASDERWQGKREEDLSAAIGRAVAHFALEVAKAGYAAGIAAREMTPHAIAQRSAFALQEAIGG